MNVNIVSAKDVSTYTTAPTKQTSLDSADAVPSGSSSITTEPFSTSDGSIVSQNDADLESLTNEISRMRSPSLTSSACGAGPSLSRSSSLMKSTKSYSELKWAEPPLEALAEPSSLTVSFANDAEIGSSAIDTAAAPIERLPLDASTTALLVVVSEYRTFSLARAAVLVCHVHQILMLYPLTFSNFLAYVPQDVQPQYWSECPSVRRDFPDFPKKLSQTIATCRQRGAKLIFVRADYRYSHSPWLAQFERLHGGRPDMRSEVPCDPNSEEFRWEDFATPGELGCSTFSQTRSKL